MLRSSIRVSSFAVDSVFLERLIFDGITDDLGGEDQLNFVGSFVEPEVKPEEEEKELVAVGAEGESEEPTAETESAE